ncbi:MULTISPECIES: Sau3AI family type II restriction endonuclease [Staphylococcus]|uniref:Sau3AI family type II restriction endonuclease n=1 Tax=Staphylococcus TaxID=1279 RepID=UPI0008A4EBB4|nr:MULTISPECIES: Sau3AI family type II restriction endonuclease [Staphylococcus]ARB76966.1 DNA mismatch repair protein MutH [Staphylococcus lugdunensis]MBM7134703.1 DNA mismatch repair protein MutH [Staphylococcus lugdunensis]MCH8643005.1 DNA mismatch repair protein MutH [Staphylococcus lugdunensis]MCH8645323.1 DNA mismatch repair protein MutH [Staphylococcus lugdunensis]MCH8670123.1 DNA mismatch repair protein MutH [Staphylococcus lugdunensis]
MTNYKTKQEVHNRAKEAVGKTIYEINNGAPVKPSKNSVGDAFEAWFGKTKDSESRPDMEEAGVELKATPYKKLKSGKFSAKERLVLNIINYEKVALETFEESSFLYKNNTIELAFYEYVKDKNRKDWKIEEAVLYEMKKNPVDYQIIKKDWEIIHKYIIDGRAHELSESLTTYLAPCTKGKNANSMRKQPYSNIQAKQRAFSLKAGYMTSLLRKYVFGNEEIESIVKNPFEVKEKTIEEIVFATFKPYFGEKIDKLAAKYNINKKAKNYHNMIASAILNLKGKISQNESFPRVEEFEKASIIVKTVKFNKNNVNKESMSFPAFSFKELDNEKWEDEEGNPQAEWHKFLLEARFLLFIVKEENNEEIFKGVKFFSMTEDEINGPVKKVWEDTVNKIRSGVELTAKYKNDGLLWRIENNFINKSDNLICHVRPHETFSDYRVNGKFADLLPSPIKWINRPKDVEKYSNQWMTKQCFWINNDYIKKQAEEFL